MVRRTGQLILVKPLHSHHLLVSGPAAAAAAAVAAAVAVAAVPIH